jgi:phosphoglycolate phosphatase
MRHHFQTVIFDFDYTLADSSKGIIDCTNFALGKLGLATVADEVVCQTIGQSLPEMFRKLAGQQHIHRSHEFVRLFVQQADQIMVDHTVLFDSVPRTVDLLNQCGATLGIVSTKYRHRIETVLKRENLLDTFQVIVGGEDVSQHKPDPQGLLLAMNRLGSTPSNTLYVGDSVTDGETAMRAGVPFVAVLSGVTSRDDFDGWTVYRIVESVSEVPGLIGC